jgi:hypothetical protein
MLLGERGIPSSAAVRIDSSRARANAISSDIGSVVDFIALGVDTDDAEINWKAG